MKRRTLEVPARVNGRRFPSAGYVHKVMSSTVAASLNFYLLLSNLSYFGVYA